MFDIDFNKLISQLLPHFLRKTALMAWLNCLMAPLVWLYNQFRIFRDEMLYEVKISGQLAYLEYMLNDKFCSDGKLRTIYITDNEDQTLELFTFNSHEIEPETFIYNTGEIPSEDTYLYNIDDAGQSSVDFTVWVPAALTFDNDYMNSLVVKYKLAGTTFQLKTYN